MQAGLQLAPKLRQRFAISKTQGVVKADGLRHLQPLDLMHALRVADADADKVIGIIPITGASYVDLGACRVFNINNVGIIAKAKPGSSSVYAALVSRGSPTYSTAAGLVLKLGVVQV